MQKLTQVLLVALVLGGLLVVYFTKQEETFQGSETIVQMNEEGFLPSEFIIRPGDRVIFINVSTSTEYWPASDLHPTHELYSAFDPLKPIIPGESWSFIFERSGTWRFHDHLHPNKRGVLIVEP